MKIKQIHEWQVTPAEARAIQVELARQVKIIPLTVKPNLIAATDISFSRGDNNLYAAVVVMRYPEAEIVETVTVKAKATFPYIPGYLSFREIPPLVTAFEKLKTVPDVIICDGQGVAHPRGLGLASHLGVLLDLPTIGCAKNRLFGEHREPGQSRWSSASLKHEKRQIGSVLRSRSAVKPIFISPGHRIDLKGAIAVIKQTTSRYRLPDPIRAAHQSANCFRRQMQHIAISEMAICK